MLSMRRFKLQLERIPFSALGKIQIDNINQLLNIVSKIIFSSVNSFLNKGFKILPTSEVFYWTFSSVQLSHQNGYLYIHATPVFENIDLLQLLYNFTSDSGLDLKQILNQTVEQITNQTSR